MSESINLVRQLLGIGVGAAVIVVIAIFVVRSALAAPVRQAGQVELERLKAALNSEMEKQRQEFTRSLEQERMTAARDLERFKAELGLVAEVRRQVASQKVLALKELMAVGSRLDVAVFNAGPGDHAAKAEALKAVQGYIAKARESSYLFPADLSRQIQDYATTLLEAGKGWERGVGGDPYSRVLSAYRELVELLRRELGIVGSESKP